MDRNSRLVVDTLRYNLLLVDWISPDPKSLGITREASRHMNLIQEFLFTLIYIKQYLNLTQTSNGFNNSQKKSKQSDARRKISNVTRAMPFA